MEESEVIRARKEKAFNFLKRNYALVSYVVLAVLVFLAVKIRTSNLAGLRDVATGGWTLGPDLDPFLFLRWAKYIVENGSMVAVDMMRYVPIGFETSKELVLHSYLIAWFHKIALLFGSESVTQSAVLFPAAMFGLAVIAFFFMTREVFYSQFGKKVANLIALIATFFLSVIPALIPRTIAGIPEKESSGVVFLFLAFYLFLISWKAENFKKSYAFALLAGLATAGMALVWGGYIYITTTLGVVGLVAFILGKVDKHKVISYGIWLCSAVSVMLLASNRFSAVGLVSSTSVGPAVFVLFVMLVDQVIFNTKIKNSIIKGKLTTLPRPVNSLIFSVVLGVVLVSVILSPSFVLEKIAHLKDQLVTPTVDRLGVTVAENRQPFFSEWAQNFGPTILKAPLLFWLFFLGSIHLFYFTVKEFKKEKGWFTIGYAIFLIALVFSRYSDSGILNGTNMASLFFYALGPIAFALIFGYSYFKKFDSEEFSKKLRTMDLGLIFVMAFFVVSVISARSAVRLIMMLAPSAAIIVAYFAVVPAMNSVKIKDSFWKATSVGASAIIIIAVLVSGFVSYNETMGSAQAYVPSVYNQQWQKAMAWVRDNTSQDAVFGHWWDYGYWVQSIGERATVLDGGNAISYWNHFMGRYALTGTNEREALEFLYAHNTTHFLIDSTDIGKYSAFSSIGSDANYDRASFIPVFQKDDTQMQERKNSVIMVYTGGITLDEDIVYEQNGSRIFLPGGAAGLAAIILEKNPSNEVISNPQGIFVYSGKQYTIPLRYAFDGELKDFGFGIEASIFLIPRVNQQGGSVSVQQDGALLYLSERVANTQLAKLYLYKQETEGFELLHSEDDFVVAQIKDQGAAVENDILYFGGIRGPIRIWKIDYPADIEFKPEFLETEYPEEIRRA